MGRKTSVGEGEGGRGEGKPVVGPATRKLLGPQGEKKGLGRKEGLRKDQVKENRYFTTWRE